jgi:glycosyltransferase involved in cell wall biosynthesis
VKLTIGYITAREEPKLDWLIDGLAQQAQPDDEIELVVVDALGRPAQALGYRPIPAIKKLVDTMPKPTIWQGPHRVTAHDFFANANARNTAIALCSNDYICFLDDRCRPDPGWLDQVRIGEKARSSVICGPYDKLEDHGLSIDHRRQHAPGGKKDCGGGWCFGGNFALPFEWVLAVNGCEEGCDPVGLEDCVFGHMLENVGYKLDFVVEMSVQQDRRGFVHPLNFPRQDKGVSPNDKSHALRERFFRRKRTEFTPDLRKLRARLAKGEPFPIPNPFGDYRDWYDGSSIKNDDCKEAWVAHVQAKTRMTMEQRATTPLPRKPK